MKRKIDFILIPETGNATVDLSKRVYLCTTRGITLKNAINKSKQRLKTWILFRLSMAGERTTQTEEVHLIEENPRWLRYKWQDKIYKVKAFFSN